MAVGILADKTASMASRFDDLRGYL
jgi:hypothetical protein